MQIRTLNQDLNCNSLEVIRGNDGDIYVTVWEQADKDSPVKPHTVRVGSAGSGHQLPSGILTALSNLASVFEKYRDCPTEADALRKEQSEPYRVLGERELSMVEALKLSIAQASIDRYTEVILQDNTGKNPAKYNVISINENDLEERPYEDPLDEVEVTCCFQRTLFDEFRSRARKIGHTEEEVMQRLVNIFVESDCEYDNIKLNENKTVTDMKEKTTSSVNQTPLDGVNPASEKEELRGVTTRELLKELKARGVTFEKVSVPVVTVQEVDIDEI